MEKRKLNKVWLWILITLSVLILCAIAKSIYLLLENHKNKYVVEKFDETINLRFLNSVSGHLEQDTIVGNFTGVGLDSIFVVTVVNHDSNLDWTECVRYFAKSNNPNIPTIELYGYISCAPKLVFEGDVDGDGKDEWGYLHTWNTSQYRQYRIYNYGNGKWRFLYYDYPEVGIRLLETSEMIRSAGIDIVEKGEFPGLIRINYDTGFPYYELRDTIVKPTYTPISDTCW